MLQYWFLPVIGALIGWITNILAIKSLFRPIRPIKVLFWTYQGLLPRYRDELAEKIGSILEEQILVTEEMEKHWQGLELETEVEKILEEYIKEKIQKILIFLPTSLQETLMEKLKKLITADIGTNLVKIRQSLIEKLVVKSKIGDFVTEKIKSLDLEKIETLVFQVVARELRHVELLGGVLGFAIGLLQMLFLYLAN